MKIVKVSGQPILFRLKTHGPQRTGARFWLGKMAEVQAGIFKQLALSKDQTQKIEKLNAKRAEEMKARMQKGKAAGATPDRERMRAEMKKNHEAYQAELKAGTLTEARVKH